MRATRFPGTPTDIGNTGAWPVPVLSRIPAGATPGRVVLQDARGRPGARLHRRGAGTGAAGGRGDPPLIRLARDLPEGDRGDFRCAAARRRSACVSTPGCGGSPSP